MQKNREFVPLTHSSKFWVSKAESISAEAIAEIEKRHSIHLPKTLREIYLISNGGQTEYIYYVKEDKTFSCFQNGTLLPFEKWELLSDFVRGYDLDDESLILTANDFAQTRIISRYGFEYFVLFIPSSEDFGGWIGQLDLATSFNETPNVKIICKADELMSGLHAIA